MFATRTLYVSALIAIAAAVSPVRGQVITGVVRGGTGVTATPPVIVPGGMAVGAVTYNDRTHVYSQDATHPFPTSLQGLDLVQVSNTDKNIADYTLDVTVNRPANLFVLVDWRVGDNSAAEPPVLTSAMTWITSSGFTDTGLAVALDENNDGSINNFFEVYSKQVAAGTTRLLEQNDTTTGGPGNRNMYTVLAGVAPVPEPAALVLTGLGCVGLAWRARRRTKSPAIS